MLTTVSAGRFSIRGISLGGIYTALQVPELDVLFDVGMAPRSFGGVRTLCLSHGHADHVGALVTLLGHRALTAPRKPLRVIMPAEIEKDLLIAVTAMERLQRFPLEIEAIGLRPGDEVALTGDLTLRAFKTFHPVPSLGYQLTRRVSKLRAEYHGRPGHEIAELKRSGAPIFDVLTRIEFAYATDTLATVLDHSPEILTSHVLMLECTFLDERKSVATARAGCHIHLDELVERADSFKNDHLVLMHFSGVHQPHEIPKILAARLPPSLMARVVPFVPTGNWPG